MTTDCEPNGPMDCRHAPGLFMPVIERNRCEGKGPCVVACRYEVLAIGILGRRERATLTWIGRIKAHAHGHRQAFVTRPEACAACGDCVRVCPERAITLTRLLADDRPPIDSQRSSP